MAESGTFYSIIIDPLLFRLRKRIKTEIRSGERVIDIACGTGAQLFELLEKADSVTGVDISESMIAYAKKNSEKRNITNAEFFVENATNLSRFYGRNFDVATLSLALHQFEPELYSSVLDEMRKVAKRIIIIDYAVPLPNNYAGIGSRIAEFLAGNEHNQNFKKYYKSGGLNQILSNNKLSIEKTILFGKDAFQLVVAY